MKPNSENIYTFHESETVFSKQLQILNKNLLLSLPANLICAIVVTFALYSISNRVFVIIWFSLVTIVTFLRLGAYYFYQRHPGYEKINFTIFLTGVILTSILWGLIDSIFMSHNILEQMLIIIVIAGITSGGSQTLHANLIASTLYVSVIITPLCIWLFLQSGIMYFAISITMTAYLIFMLVTCVRGHKLLKRTLNLAYDNLALINNLSTANKKLLQSYKVLEEHDHTMSLITKMNDLLQTCNRLNEAYNVIIFTAKNLFSHFYGGFYVLNPGTKMLKKIETWGKDSILKSEFTLDECWALRKGHSYYVNDVHNEFTCYHFNSPPRSYICLPLHAQNELIGLLILHTDTATQITDYDVQITTSFSEVIQVTLSNIKLRENLYDQSIHDPLTGLYNRRYLDELLTRELRRVIREGKTLCVAMLDIDLFKNFNDTNGHEAGDEILKYLGKLFNESFRDTDIVCRFGGEEFIVVLTNTTLAEACKRLEIIRTLVKKGIIKFNNLILPPVTVSIGIAEAPQQGTITNDIIQAADDALYKAKKMGRDRIETNQKISL